MTGHHAPHDAEPHVMVGVDEARHNDAFRSVDDFSAVCLDVRADARTIRCAFHQQVANCEIGDGGIHRDDDASLEEGCRSMVLSNVMVTSVSARQRYKRRLRAQHLSLAERNLELSALMSDAS